MEKRRGGGAGGARAEIQPCLPLSPGGSGPLGSPSFLALVPPSVSAALPPLNQAQPHCFPAPPSRKPHRWETTTTAATTEGQFCLFISKEKERLNRELHTVNHPKHQPRFTLGVEWRRPEQALQPERQVLVGCWEPGPVTESPSPSPHPAP